MLKGMPTALADPNPSAVDSGSRLDTENAQSVAATDGPFSRHIPEIETERLVLRGPVEGDVEAWARHLNPEDFRFMPWKKTDETPSQRAARGLAAIVDQWRAEPVMSMEWVISRKTDGAVLGIGGIAQNEEGVSEGEIGYRLGRPFWGQGYASEAARAMTRYGFENTSWERIVAYVVHENVASVRVAQGLGMTYVKDVDYSDVLGDMSGYQIASTMTALYAVARDDFKTRDEAYSVRRVD